MIVRLPARSPTTMECEIIKGKYGGDMLYVPSEQMFYTFEAERKDGTKIFVCYQTVLTRNDSNQIKCSSRVRLFPNGTCERMDLFLPHTTHPDHEQLVRDKKSMHTMKEQCRYLRETHPEDAHKIPNRRIFERVITK